MNCNEMVSVIIPVYKVEKYLEASVRSVIEQSYKNIEIILVDDGSPDSCPAICDDFASQYPFIHVIHKENGGLSDARNFGLQQAKGDFILFLDSDDTLDVLDIEGLMHEALTNQADIVLPDRYIQVSEATKKAILKFHFDKTGYIENPLLFALEVMIGKGRAWRAHSLLYRADTIRTHKIEFPVGYIAEDIVFNLKVFSYAKKLAFYDLPTVFYLKRAGSITTSFQKDLDKVFLFIDQQVDLFLVNNNLCNVSNFLKKDELLCRNMIVYISGLFSKKCNWSSSDRITKANDLLNLTRVKKAFAIKKINPYFDSGLVRLYFSILFFLIKNNVWRLAYWIASLRG